MSRHPTAIIDAKADLHPSVEVGPYAVIGKGVVIGEGTRVGAHSVIEGRTRIGKGNRIFHFASVGADPQDLKYKGEDTELVMGDGNIVREFVTLHRGTAQDLGVTRIGNGNLFMANAHVAHDCVVGDGCVVANSAAVAGHCVIDDHVVLGGLVGVHQFTRIGAHAFVGGGSMVGMDIPPYCIAQGFPAELAGLNTVGLKRHGMTEEQLRRIKGVYRIFFRSKLGLNEALARAQAEFGGNAEIDSFLSFMSSSKRGVAR